MKNFIINILFLIVMNVVCVFVDMHPIVMALCNILYMVFALVLYELKIIYINKNNEEVKEKDNWNFVILKEEETKDLYNTLMENGVDTLDGCSFHFNKVTGIGIGVVFKKGRKAIWDNYKFL